MTTCPASASAEHTWTRLPSEPQHWLCLHCGHELILQHEPKHDALGYGTVAVPLP